MTEQEIVNVLPEDLPNNPEPNAYEPPLNIAGRVKRMQSSQLDVEEELTADPNVST